MTDSVTQAGVPRPAWSLKSLASGTSRRCSPVGVEPAELGRPPHRPCTQVPAVALHRVDHRQRRLEPGDGAVGLRQDGRFDVSVLRRARLRSQTAVRPDATGTRSRTRSSSPTAGCLNPGRRARIRRGAGHGSTPNLLPTWCAAPGCAWRDAARVSTGAGLALDAAGRQSGGDVALQEEEEHHDRERGEHRAGGEDAPVLAMRCWATRSTGPTASVCCSGSVAPRSRSRTRRRCR